MTSMRKGKSTQGRSADAVELTERGRVRCHVDDDDDRPRLQRRPLPLPLLHLVVLLFSLLARLARLVLAKLLLLPASSLLPSLRIYFKWRSTRLRGRAFGAPLPPDERDDDRDQRPPPLPTDAGLAALRLANCRDLASACDPPLVVPGRLFRSASPFAVCGGQGQGEEAEEAEVVAAAAAEAARALSAAASAPAASPSSPSPSPSPLGLNLALVIDLRSANEWETGSGAEALRALEALSRGKGESGGDDGGGSGKSKTDGGNSSTTATTATPTTTLPRVERVALQEWARYTHAFVARLPATRSLGAASHFLLFKYLLGFGAPIPGMHARLCADTERGGLLAMNTTVLAAFPLEIARVLRLVTFGITSSGAAAATASSSRSSVMVACKLGKDRTGLVSALCLSVAGASRREVVSDYARSAAELAGRPAPATALGGAPTAAMERSLDWLSEHFARFADEVETEGYRRRERRRREEKEGEDPRWRARVLGYLDREARFLAGEREALRRALTEQ